MPKIFVSYRREDSAGHAGRLIDHLRLRFGTHNVFMDVDDIGLGQDFKHALTEAVHTCDVMIVVIGKRWLECRNPTTGARRVDEEGDWVCQEAVDALQRGIPVIPVLVQGASLPDAAAMPASMRALADRQSTTLIDAQWDSSASDLVRRLETIGGPSNRPRAGRANTALIFGGLGAALAAGVVLFALFGREAPPETVVPSPMPSALASPTPSANASPSPPGELEVRLEALRRLHDDGLITKDEYEQRRDAILKNF